MLGAPSLAAAETGHLVFSTVHTGDVASAIPRIADGFPPERQHSIRSELAPFSAGMVVAGVLIWLGFMLLALLSAPDVKQ